MKDFDVSVPATPHYVEPNAEFIGSFARTACRTLAQTLDKQYADPDVVRGLEEFLKIIAGMATGDATSQTVYAGTAIVKG